MAMAPPLTFVLARSAPISAAHASTTGANASFTSNRSMSDSDRPERESTFAVAGMTPVSMYNGSEPTAVMVWMRANGSRPWLRAKAPLVIMTAALPSDSGDELPGVISQRICGKRAP